MDILLFFVGIGIGIFLRELWLVYKWGLAFETKLMLYEGKYGGNDD